MKVSLAIAIVSLVTGAGLIWTILLFFGPLVDTGIGLDFWRFASLPYRLLALSGILFVVIMILIIATLERPKGPA